jgi:hypothetical protein
MSRKFVGAKEIAFINEINRELIQRVVGQTVYYYEILAEKTQADDLYNEAIVKAWAPPVACTALVLYENTTESITNIGADAKFNLDVYFHKAEVDERNLDPKMGDFVQFGSILFEIYSVTQPQITFGQIENKVMTKCTCGPARKGQFAPTLQPLPVTRTDLNAPAYPTQPSERAYTGDPRRKP